MANSIPGVIHNWLKREKMEVSKTLLKEKLLSHPDYPSLLSVTDTLDELNIPNTAVRIEKEQLPEIPTPFLAHLGGAGGEFVVVGNRDNLDAQFKNFYRRWGGVVVAAEKPADWKHEENEEFLKKDKERKYRTVVSLAALLMVSGVAAGMGFSWTGLGLMLVALGGLFVSWMIVSKELGIENKLAEQVCGKEADCNAVIQSKGAKLPFEMKWSDVGVIWFTSLFLLHTVSSFAGSSAASYAPLSLFAVAALPFTFFSVGYQWKVVKKWCRLCLVTLGLLWFQFFILLPEGIVLAKGGWQVLSTDSILLIVALLISVTVVWLWIKPVIAKNKELESESFSARRFKYNPEVFKFLLTQQRKVDVTPFESDIQLGNPDAKLQIVVASNLYCNPCAKAHKILSELVVNNDIGLIVRLAIRANDEGSDIFQAATYLLQLLEGSSSANVRKVMHTWYDIMDLEKFRNKFPLQLAIDVGKLLRRHHQWTEEFTIMETPSIFIEGYEMPKEYKLEDLRRVIKGRLAEQGINEYNYVHINI